jgi:hypothetical protein
MNNEATVAQTVEQLPCKQKVGGSIPSSGSIYENFNELVSSIRLMVSLAGEVVIGRWTINHLQYYGLRDGILSAGCWRAMDYDLNKILYYNYYTYESETIDDWRKQLALNKLVHLMELEDESVPGRS